MTKALNQINSLNSEISGYENDISKEITFKELRPGEFRVYKMI